jgi:hypothetical protein
MTFGSFTSRASHDSMPALAKEWFGDHSHDQAIGVQWIWRIQLLANQRVAQPFFGPHV